MQLSTNYDLHNCLLYRLPSKDGDTYFAIDREKIDEADRVLMANQPEQNNYQYADEVFVDGLRVGPVVSATGNTGLDIIGKVPVKLRLNKLVEVGLWQPEGFEQYSVTNYLGSAESFSV